MSRVNDLLVLAASSLKEGCVPLSHQWLVDNDVTFDEANDVADAIATAIHVYLAVAKTAIRQGELETKRDRTLADNVESMVISHRGAIGVLLDGVESALSDTR